MKMDQGTAQELADAYTEAWDSGSAEAVAFFYAPDRHVPDLSPVWDAVRWAGSQVAYFWTFPGLTLRIPPAKPGHSIEGGWREA